MAWEYGPMGAGAFFVSTERSVMAAIMRHLRIRVVFLILLKREIDSRRGVVLQQESSQERLICT